MQKCGGGFALVWLENVSSVCPERMVPAEGYGRAGDGPQVGRVLVGDCIF